MLLDFFRNSALRKMSSKEPTSIIPMEKVNSAVALIDVEDTSFDDCKMSLMSFFRSHGIKGEIFFFDFRKISSGERLITSITNTILKRDLNWYGRPSAEKLNILDTINPDLFISLIDDDSFTLEFTVKYCKARFKIGRRQLPGDVFDLVITDPSDRKLSEYESFEAIKTFINKIK